MEVTARIVLPGNTCPQCRRGAPLIRDSVSGIFVHRIANAVVQCGNWPANAQRDFAHDVLRTNAYPGKIDR